MNRRSGRDLHQRDDYYRSIGMWRKVVLAMKAGGLISSGMMIRKEDSSIMSLNEDQGLACVQRGTVT